MPGGTRAGRRGLASPRRHGFSVARNAAYRCDNLGGRRRPAGAGSTDGVEVCRGSRQLQDVRSRRGGRGIRRDRRAAVGSGCRRQNPHPPVRTAGVPAAMGAPTLPIMSSWLREPGAFPMRMLADLRPEAVSDVGRIAQRQNPIRNRPAFRPRARPRAHPPRRRPTATCLAVATGAWIAGSRLEVPPPVAAVGGSEARRPTPTDSRRAFEAQRILFISYIVTRSVHPRRGRSPAPGT